MVRPQELRKYIRRNKRHFVRRFAAYAMGYAVEIGLDGSIENPKLPVSLTDKREDCLLVAKPAGQGLQLRTLREVKGALGVGDFVQDLVLHPKRFLRFHNYEWYAGPAWAPPQALGTRADRRPDCRAGLLFCAHGDELDPREVVGPGCWALRRNAAAIFDPDLYRKTLREVSATRMAREVREGWGAWPEETGGDAELFDLILSAEMWRAVGQQEQALIAALYDEKKAA